MIIKAKKKTNDLVNSIKIILEFNAYSVQPFPKRYGHKTGTVGV